MAGREIVNRQVSIFIQSGDAQKVYDKLIAKQKQYNQELATATNPKRIQELRNNLAKLEEPISRAAKKLSGELNPSLNDVRSTVNRLRNELKHMSEQDADFGKVTSQYRQANKELQEQQIKIGLLSRAWKSFWQEAKTVAVGVIIGNTIQSALQSVLGYVTGIVSGSAKISDELADIQRVTGLTKQDVSAINSELKKLDTRTSTSALREIALVAGRLGIEGKDNIVAFTKAVDQLNIALGGELGDIQSFTTELGKILNVFEGKITAENITAVGNAIVDLANKGVASGPFIVDFVQRIASIAKTSNLSLDAAIGLAAGLEESGARVESSSTAIQKVLSDIASDIPAAAKVAGVELAEFNKLFSSQPQEALLRYAEGLVKNKESFAEVTKAFKDQGEEGARVISVLATIGQRTDFFREKITDAGKALKDTTSITAAFELKNKTAGAELDKFRKNFASLFTSRTFQEAGAAAIRVMNGFVNVIKGIPEFIEKNRFALLTLAAGILLLNKAYITAALVTVRDTAAKILNTIVTKGSAVATNIAVAAQAAYITVTNLLIGRITVAAAAQRLWNLSLSIGAGGLGLILVAVGAVAVAIGALVGKTKALTQEQSLQLEINKRVNDNVGEQVALLKTRLQIAHNEKLSLDDRKKALDEVKKSSDGYLNNLTLENIKTGEGKKLIDDYIESLRKAARARAVAELAQEKEKRKIEIETALNIIGTTNVSDETGAGAFLKNLFAALGIGSGTKGQQIRDLNNELNNLTNELDGLYKIVASDKEVQTEIIKDPKKITTGIKNVSAATKGATDDLAELAKELENMRVELTATGLDKELALLEQKYAKLRARAKNNKALLEEIEILHGFEKLKIIEDFIKKETDRLKKADEDEVKRFTDRSQKVLQRNAEILNKVFDSINRDKLARKELDVINARGKEKLKAELALLDEQERQELAKKDIKENEKLLIENKYRSLRLKAELDHIKNIIETTIFFVQGVANIDKIFSDAATERENNELERDRRLNDTKIKNLQRQLNSKLITQLQYDRQVQKIEKEQEKREKEARVKQFNRDKRAQLVAAAINLAGAGLTTLQKFGPPIPPNFLGIAAMALTLATGAANIIAIASKKPPEFARGGTMKGKGRSHAAGGNDIIDQWGTKIGEVEEGEAWINKFSMRDKKKYTVTGTPSQIASRINSLHGGVNWDSGAKLNPAWRNVKPMPMNFAAIHKYYHAAGGVFGGAGTSGGVDIDAMKDILETTTLVMSELRDALRRPVRAHVVYQDVEDAGERLNAIRDDATMKG